MGLVLGVSSGGAFDRSGQRRGAAAPLVRPDVPAGLQACGAARQHREAGDAAYFAAFVRNAPARLGLRHSQRSGAAWASRCRDDHDLHPCAEGGRSWCAQPARSSDRRHALGTARTVCQCTSGATPNPGAPIGATSAPTAAPVTPNADVAPVGLATAVPVEVSGRGGNDALEHQARHIESGAPAAPFRSRARPASSNLRVACLRP